MAAPLLRPREAGAGGRRVRLVTFDLDDCLWDSVAVMTRAEEARQAALAAEFPRIAERWGWREFRTEVMQRLADTRPEIRHSPTDLQQEGLRWCAAEAGYRDEAERVVEVGYGAFAAARLRPTLFAEALPTLRALRSQGKVIGTLTNGNGDALAIEGLRDLIDFALTAQDVGDAKPSRAMFEAALTAANLPDLQPGECVHVGVSREWLHAAPQQRPVD